MTTTASSPFAIEVTAKKWNPGYYMGFNFSKSHQATFAQRQTRYYEPAANDPLVKGVYMEFGWDVLEPTQGNYNWAPLHQELDYLGSLPEPKHLWIHPAAMSFADRTTNGHLPQYVIDAGGLSTNLGNNNRGDKNLKYWEPQYMAMYITFMEALAAEFDDHPYLEIVNAPKETALGNGHPTMDKAAFMSGLVDLATAMNAAFKKTNIAIAANFQSPPETHMYPMIEQLRALSPAVGLTFPDVIPQFVNDDVTQGELWPMDQHAYNMIRADLAGLTNTVTSQVARQPVFARAETSELGGPINGARRQDGIATTLGGRGYVVSSLRDFADFTLKSSHISLPHNDDFATILDEQKWTTAALPEMALHPVPSNSGYPY